MFSATHNIPVRRSSPPGEAPPSRFRARRTPTPTDENAGLRNENVTLQGRSSSLYDKDTLAFTARDRSRDKALLVAAQGYPDSDDLSPLSTPHADQKKLYAFLISTGFESANIHRLSEDNHDSYWHPTKSNILREFRWLASGVCPGDFVVLYLAGHAIQVPCTTGSEQDGMDEAFMTIDPPHPHTKNNLILDNVIRRLVVNSLPGGSFLLAILDTCSSETLLDLDSTTKYTPVMWPADKDPESPTLPPTPSPPQGVLEQVSNLPQNHPGFLDTGARSGRSSSPMAIDPDFENLPSQLRDRRSDFAYVFSISACHDGEKAWSDAESMLHHLLHILKKHVEKPLTPINLEKKLHDRMYKARRRVIEAAIKKQGQSWNSNLEVRARTFQTPRITTLPGHKEILTKPLPVFGRPETRPRPFAPANRVFQPGLA